MKLEKLVVNEENNLRIDKYLSNKLDLSREYIQELIKKNEVLVNGTNVKSSYVVNINDVIEYNNEYKKEMNLVPKQIDFEIIYEDEYLMVINKPSGLTVHPGSGNKDNTLVNGLLYYGKNLSNIGGLERPGIVHRIDKDTSGLLMVAKNDQVHNILADDFKNKRIIRKYTALLVGVIPNDKIVIDAPIGRDEKYREKFTVTSKNSKKAVTHLTVLKRYKEYTLASLVLETGRTHQIRVHTKYIGYPVYNDPIYTNKEANKFGQFLHSSYLEFIHPITKEKKTFECPIPLYFQEFIDNLE